VRQARNGHAGQDQTCQDGDGERVLLNLLMPGGVPQPKHYVLEFIVDPSTCSESLGVWIGGEVGQIALEQPEGLHMD
jgi:hypothetical protein